MNNELYHYGVLGMKWGVRRYQNPDGTLIHPKSPKVGVSMKEARAKLKTQTRESIFGKRSSKQHEKIQKRKQKIDSFHKNVDSIKQKLSNPETRKKIMIGAAAVTTALIAVYGQKKIKDYVHNVNRNYLLEVGASEVKKFMDSVSRSTPKMPDGTSMSKDTIMGLVSDISNDYSNKNMTTKEAFRNVTNLSSQERKRLHGLYKESANSLDIYQYYRNKGSKTGGSPLAKEMTKYIGEHDIEKVKPPRVDVPRSIVRKASRDSTLDEVQRNREMIEENWKRIKRNLKNTKE